VLSVWEVRVSDHSALVEELSGYNTNYRRSTVRQAITFKERDDRAGGAGMKAQSALNNTEFQWHLESGDTRTRSINILPEHPEYDTPTSRFHSRSSIVWDNSNRRRKV
jgi:hypothetical protein